MDIDINYYLQYPMTTRSANIYKYLHDMNTSTAAAVVSATPCRHCGSSPRSRRCVILSWHMFRYALRNLRLDIAFRHQTDVFNLYSYGPYSDDICSYGLCHSKIRQMSSTYIVTVHIVAYIVMAHGRAGTAGARRTRVGV